MKTFLWLVGIDEYLSEDVPNLQGCVNDVDLLCGYLTRAFTEREKGIDLRVFRLTNAEATRENIITGFRRDLIRNPAIQEGDRIVIFFAGHGGLMPAPKDSAWKTRTGKIEAFCPYDMGEGTPAIPDITLSILLRQLVKNKGDNITAIFDSCHAAGFARGAQELGPGVRTTRYGHDIPLGDFDQDIRLEYNAAITSDSSGCKRRHLYNVPCAMLFSCEADQSAKESPKESPNGERWNGNFTRHLVEFLEKGHNITPLDLAEGLASSFKKLEIRQTPSAEGKIKETHIFRSTRLSLESTALLLKRIKGTDDQFQVGGGPELGLECGDEVDVCDFPPGRTPVIVGRLRVVDPQARNGVILSSPESLPGQSFPNNSNLQIIPTPILNVFLECDLSLPANPVQVAYLRRQEQKSKADLVIGRTEDPSGKEFILSLTRPLKGETPSFTIKVSNNETLWHKVDHLHHFRTTLLSMCGPAPFESVPTHPAVELGSSPGLPVELYRLEYDAKSFYGPQGDNLFRKKYDVRLPYDSAPEVRYGMKVIQDVAQDMYIYVFCFCAKNLSIELYHASHGKVKRGESSDVGWNGDPSDPIYFESEVHDYGVFFKAIATSDPQETSLWERGSIFDHPRTSFRRAAPPPPIRLGVSRVVAITVEGKGD